MSSAVSIARRALLRIGTKPIDSIEDTEQEQAAVVRAFFDDELAAELRSHNWNCAITRVVLAALTTKSVFGDLYVYPLPVDCLRPLIPADVDWVLEGRSLLSEDSDGLEVRYIKNVTDVSQLDETFASAFVLRLAVAMCEKLGSSVQRKNLLIAEYNEAIRLARKTNAIEKRSDDIPDCSWVVGR